MSQPLPVESTSLMGVLGNISTLFTIEQGVAGLFSSEPSLSNIVSLIVDEVQAIFLQDEANSDLMTSNAELQSVINYFQINYANDVKALYSNQQLYSDLTNSVNISMHDFDTQINLMTTWATSFDPSTDASQQNIACQALSFCLLGYHTMTMYYKELAVVAEDQDVRNSNWASMQSYAGMAATNLAPIFNALKQFRLNSFQYTEQTITPDPNNPEISFNIEWLTDNYTGDYCSVNTTICPDFDFASIQNAITTYLTSGNDADFQTIISVIATASAGECGDMASDFWSNSYQQKVYDFGKWYLNATNFFTTMSTVANAVNTVSNGNVTNGLYVVDSSNTVYLMLDGVLRSFSDWWGTYTNIARPGAVVFYLSSLDGYTTKPIPSDAKVFWYFVIINGEQLPTMFLSIDGTVRGIPSPQVHDKYQFADISDDPVSADYFNSLTPGAVLG